LIDRLEGRTLGDYHILDKIGQGGMTSVYKALDLARHRMVALKVLSPYIGQDPSFNSRFQREIKLLGQLRHPHIVPILDFGESDLYTYIVMPYYAEGTLQDRLRKSPLDPYEIARMTKQMCSALDFAHQKGIVHRDVKPSNILINDEGKALLSDFGFAQVADISMSLTGSALIGTPAYMSPEQCKGAAIGPQSDQYSLGIVLYQLFTGQVPYGGETPMAVAVQHINEPLPRPGRVNPDLPEPLDNVLVKVLAKEPKHRYAGMKELNAAFQTAIRDSVDGFGRLVPPVNRFSLNTFIMERTPLGKPIEIATGMWRQQRPLVVSILLLLLLLPTAGYAVASLTGLNQEEPRAELIGGNDELLQATIDALSTEISAEGGGQMDPSLIEAAVAGTLSANARLQSGRPTPTPGLFETLMANQVNPTATSQSGFLGLLPGATGTPTSSSSGSGGSGGGNPTNTPVPSKTYTPTPTYTPAPPTNTPLPPTNTAPPPTNTPIPPTATAKPINPNACNPDEGHPNYCTPEP
jgi:serine/threonine protein kinase